MINRLLGINFVVHLLLALLLPLGNDEAYYWDWGQALALSYKDHPPAISWLSALSAQVPVGLLQVRFCAPILHTFWLWCVFASIAQLVGQDRSKAALDRTYLIAFMIVSSSPGLFFIGSISIPDIGLIAFMQALIYLLCRSYRQPRLTLGLALLAGVLMALSGLFKYHALPLALSAFGVFFYCRRHSWSADMGFYCVSAAVGVGMCWPVWLWNSQHEWASLAFQTAHGFSGGAWSLTYPTQGVLAVALLIGPGFVVLALSGAYRGWVSGRGRIAVAAALSLLVLIFLASLRKPILPHWALPAFALLTPFIVLSPYLSQRAWRLGQYGYGALVAGLLLLLSVTLQLRAHWLAHFSGDPGPLSELTVWEPLADALEPALLSAEKFCANRPTVVATLTWYANAQLHFARAHAAAPMLVSDDPYAYYVLRDAARDVRCVALVVGPDETLPAMFAQRYEVLGRQNLQVLWHENQHWQLIWAYVRDDKYQHSVE